VYVQMWKDLGVSRLVGIDISEAASAAMRTRFPEFQFFKRDLGAPGLADVVGTGFGLVTAVDMLYHIIEDDAFEHSLANLEAATAPGGLLAIHDVFMDKAERNHGYMRLRVLADYKKALERAGFEVLAHEPTFFTAVQWLKSDGGFLKSLHDRVWRSIMGRALPRVPGVAGAATYAIDRVVGAVKSTGPSFEMMICRKRK